MMDLRIPLAVLAVTLAVYYFCFRGLGFFRRHGIRYIPPVPFFGNMAPPLLQRMSIADLVRRMYELNRDAKYVGFYDFSTPVVVVRDPDLVKSIAVKNFDSFTDHRGFSTTTNDFLFDNNLMTLRGDTWREFRAILTPAFTGSKMKGMFKLMDDCSAEFAGYLAQLPAHGNVLEMKDCFTRYANDMIATCAFGIDVDSMRDRQNKFYVYGRQATNFDTWRSMKFLMVRGMPWLTRALGLRIIDRHIARFFKDLVADAIAERDARKIVRPDMLQLMMESRDRRAADGKRLSIEQMTAQAFIFFFGGFESTSTLMCFAAHEIATNPRIQATLRREIDEALKKCDGQLTYETVNELPYLDAVINEALRMYPVGVFMDRQCTRDFELPPALPGDRPFVLKKGSTVWFPAYGLHRDSKYFHDPDTFIPERFLGESNGETAANSPAFLPFGIGPRMCIGNRFALLETKVLFVHMLARCVLRPCEKTANPIRLSKRHLAMQAASGFWLKIEARGDAGESCGTIDPGSG